MKNKTVLVMLVALSATMLVFTGCGNKENDTVPVVSEAVEDVEETEIVEDIVEEPIKAEETDNTISDNWEDLEFLLEGIKFKIPCYIKEFEKTGWIFRANGYAL